MKTQYITTCLIIVFAIVPMLLITSGCAKTNDIFNSETRSEVFSSQPTFTSTSPIAINSTQSNDNVTQTDKHTEFAEPTKTADTSVKTVTTNLNTQTGSAEQTSTPTLLPVEFPDTYLKPQTDSPKETETHNTNVHNVENKIKFIEDKFEIKLPEDAKIVYFRVENIEAGVNEEAGMYSDVYADTKICVKASEIESLKNSFGEYRVETKENSVVSGWADYIEKWDLYKSDVKYFCQKFYTKYYYEDGFLKRKGATKWIIITKDIEGYSYIYFIG